MSGKRNILAIRRGILTRRKRHRRVRLVHRLRDRTAVTFKIPVTAVDRLYRMASCSKNRRAPPGAVGAQRYSTEQRRAVVKGNAPCRYLSSMAKLCGEGDILPERRRIRTGREREGRSCLIHRLR